MFLLIKRGNDEFMEYKLNTGIWNDVFAVPGCVAKKYLKLARGSDIKILLYMLYNNSKILDLDSISKEIDVQRDTVEEAILFWKNVGLISDGKEPLKSNEQEQIKTNEEDFIQNKNVKNEVKKISSTIAISPREIADRVKNSDEMTFLFEYAEKTFGNPLTNSNQRSLVWLRDYVGFPVDVIQMLFEYCKMVGQLNVRYIEKTAINWQDKGIVTHEDAEQEIDRCIKLHTYQVKVMSEFGINRKLIQREINYISDWQSKSISMELVSIAY